MAEEAENATPAGDPVPENVTEEMHDGRDAPLSSELGLDKEETAPHSPTEAKIYRLFGREKPVHRVLGGGKAADVLLWRNKKVSTTVLGGATAVWVLFVLLEYRFLSLVSHVLIFLLSALFLWSNARTIIKKSLPHIPEVFIPEEPFLQTASAVALGLNQSLAVLREVACGRDLKKFLTVVAGLWILSVVGCWFNFLTLLYISLVLLHTLPPFYEKYEHKVDPLAERGMSEVSQRYSRLIGIIQAKIATRGFKKKVV